ncbi:prolipoprotein diacylglyceryl transferase, partial [Vibrio parahaemolyticus]|nr:prolipoprotein diacylglyceryl transferase [Vibrio parahaemolyticus]
ANRRADNPGSGWTREQVSDLLFAGVLGVVIGGRVGYGIFYNFELFLDDPLDLFTVWPGGMSCPGGVLGVITAMVWSAHK